MKSIQNIKLLILDDIGLKSYTLKESRDILEITESRYNRASTVLAGQVSHTKWYELFPDTTIADAIMDRIVHNSYILTLDSKKSMREVMAEKTIKKMKYWNKINLQTRCPDAPVYCPDKTGIAVRMCRNMHP